MPVTYGNKQDWEIKSWTVRLLALWNPGPGNTYFSWFSSLHTLFIIAILVTSKKRLLFVLLQFLWVLETGVSNETSDETRTAQEKNGSDGYHYWMKKVTIWLGNYVVIYSQMVSKTVWKGNHLANKFCGKLKPNGNPNHLSQLFDLSAIPNNHFALLQTFYTSKFKVWNQIEGHNQFTRSN